MQVRFPLKALYRKRVGGEGADVGSIPAEGTKNARVERDMAYSPAPPRAYDMINTHHVQRFKAK